MIECMSLGNSKGYKSLSDMKGGSTPNSRTQKINSRLHSQEVNLARSLSKLTVSM